MAHRLFHPATIGLAGAAAALAVAAAGPATADVSANFINVVGTTFQTGQSYTIQVTVPAGASATVQDTSPDGLRTTVIGLAQAPAGSTVATLQWTPMNPGTHGIWATVTQTSVSTGTASVNVTGNVVTTGSSSGLDTFPIIGPILKAIGL